MRRRHWFLPGVATFLLISCGADERADNAVVEETPNATENGESASSSPGAPAAAEFATMVAASDLYEIESGKLAAEKARSSGIKSFAEMLVTDHEKSTADLKSAASKANPSVNVLASLDSEKQAMVDALEQAKGADFDRAFIDQQKQAHQKALALLRQYESTGEDQALQDFAAKAAPVVQRHLNQLNGLQP